MADYFVVETARGPAWDDSKRRREQTGWEAHAAFMDGLVADRFVVLGGPIGDVEGDLALLVVDATGDDEVRERLAADPWAGGVLSTRSVRPWTIWLRRTAASSDRAAPSRSPRKSCALRSVTAQGGTGEGVLT